MPYAPARPRGPQRQARQTGRRKAERGSKAGADEALRRLCVEQDGDATWWARALQGREEARLGQARLEVERSRGTRAGPS